jgi:hypothetical protein
MVLFFFLSYFFLQIREQEGRIGSAQRQGRRQGEERWGGER